MPVHLPPCLLHPVNTHWPPDTGTVNISDPYQCHPATSVGPAGTMTGLSSPECHQVHVPGAQAYGEVEVLGDLVVPRTASGEV